MSLGRGEDQRPSAEILKTTEDILPMLRGVEIILGALELHESINMLHELERTIRREREWKADIEYAGRSLQEIPVPPRAFVSDVPIDRWPLTDLLDRLAWWSHFCDIARYGWTPMTINVVNAHSVVEAQSNGQHMMALEEAWGNLADGWPIARLARTERIAGADLMLAAARHPELAQRRHVLLGGFGVAYQAAVRQFHEAKTAVGIVPPWLPKMASEDLVEAANAVPCDILWVALGCPKQEIWMHENRDKLNAKVVIGVGAAFDFLAGRVRRAPKIVQRMGLEWAWRIVQEPQRWRRQVGAVTGLVKLLLR